LECDAIPELCYRTSIQGEIEVKAFKFLKCHKQKETNTNKQVLEAQINPT